MYPVERLIIVRDFCGFLCSRGVRILANFHVVVGVIRKIKMARNWFGHICVVFFLHLVGVRESGQQIFSLFRVHGVQVTPATDDISGGACKVVSDFSGLIGS